MRQGLQRAVLLLALAATSLSAAALEADPAGGCRLRQLAELDVEILPGYGAVIPVQLDGRAVRMSLNTSTAYSLIPDSIATGLNLPRQDVAAAGGLATVNGSPILDAVRFQTVTLGNLNIRNMVLGVRPEQEGERYPKPEGAMPWVGTVGMDLLSAVDFELDLAAKKVRLFSQDHCQGNVVYWTQDYTQLPLAKDSLGVVYFPLELDGRQIEATLATGATMSLIDARVAERVYGFNEKSAGVEKEVVEGSGATASVRPMALTAQGINVRNARIRLSNRGKGCAQAVRATHEVKAIGYSNCEGVYPLTLGQNVLSRLRVYVATKENMVYVSRADAK